MSRRAILRVVKTNYTPSAPWMVRVPQRLHRIEGARKKFFAKESIAKAYVERLAKTAWRLPQPGSRTLGPTKTRSVRVLPAA